MFRLPRTAAGVGGLHGPGNWVGILGATVMPHNLYLHSSIVQMRHFANDERSRHEAMPAFGGVLLLGEGGIGKLLVLSQVALSFQLPFAIWPLIRLTSDPQVMGRYANGILTKAIAWSLFALITVANVWLVLRLAAPKSV